MKYIFFTLATLAVCVSRVSAQGVNTAFSPPPVGTVGHTTVVAKNTVFIQGGGTSSGPLSKASYAIILDNNKSLKNATWLDTTTLSAFTSRVFGVAAANDNVMITCGGISEENPKGIRMTCDQFDLIWYKKTNIDPANVSNRGGMAVAYQKSSKGTKAYLIGGGNSDTQNGFTMDVVNIPIGNPATVTWSKGADLNIATPRYYATATWVDNSVGGIVVLGGANSSSITQSLGLAFLYTAATNIWTLE
jgi:hypothetical protein